MKLMKISIILVILLSSGVFVSTVAFESFNADRSAEIDVVSDDVGLIGLEPGDSSVVFLQDEDLLTIDLGQTGAQGLNLESVLQVGDDQSPETSQAFIVTNNDQEERDITFNYQLDSEVEPDDSVTFQVFDDQGSNVGEFSDSASLDEQSLPSGQSFFVTLEIDTSELSSEDDLSGTLVVQAE